MFDKMYMEMKGETEEERNAKRTKEQLKEIAEKKLEKKKNMAQARKLEKIVCLKDINVKITKGKFVCIIGKAGAGKSSLLSAITGELLPMTKGIVERY
jgi:ABC-type polysaccharide/polyol phosphate transport system ATPase subunit